MIYVCSDIHGQFALFKKMLKRIRFSENDTLYIIGDIIDRGPSSIALLQYVMEQSNIIPLLGNHELMLYNHFFKLEKDDSWLLGNNGGSDTLKEFQKLSEEDRKKVLQYIRDMLLQKEVEVGGKTFLLSHSFFMEQEIDVYWKDVNYYDAVDTVWFSPWRFWEFVSRDRYERDRRIHIIGHVPVFSIPKEDWVDEKVPEMPQAYQNKSIINIDLGCAAMGLKKYQRPEHLALCCLCLDKLVKGEDAFTYIEKESNAKKE